MISFWFWKVGSHFSCKDFPFRGLRASHWQRFKLRGKWEVALHHRAPFLPENGSSTFNIVSYTIIEARSFLWLVAGARLEFSSANGVTDGSVTATSVRNFLGSIESSSFISSVGGFLLGAMSRSIPIPRMAFRAITSKENHPPTLRKICIKLLPCRLSLLLSNESYPFAV